MGNAFKWPERIVRRAYTLHMYSWDHVFDGTEHWSILSFFKSPKNRSQMSGKQAGLFLLNNRLIIWLSAAIKRRPLLALGRKERNTIKCEEFKLLVIQLLSNYWPINHLCRRVQQKNLSTVWEYFHSWVLIAPSRDWLMDVLEVIREERTR